MNHYEMPEAQRPDPIEQLQKAYAELSSLVGGRVEVKRTEWPGKTQAEKDCLHMTFYYLQQALKGGAL